MGCHLVLTSLRKADAFPVVASLQNFSERKIIILSFLAMWVSARVRVELRYQTWLQLFKKEDSAIHRINHYPVDNVIGLRITYPLDSDLSRV